MLFRELNRVCVMNIRYNNSITYIIHLLIAIALCNVCFTAPSYSATERISATKNAVITVPDGKILHTIVTTPINSKYLSVGQTVTLVLGESFCHNNKVIAPADSMIYGSVISSKKAANGNPAELLLRFNQMVTPYGIQIPLYAVVKTSDNSGKISGDNIQYADSNKEINIPVTGVLDLVLTQPITVNPELYNSNY